MSRKRRVHFNGALYHVMCKGNNGEEIFKNDLDKQIYINIIKRYKEKYDFKLYAYCIMDNHVHMLIEVSEIPLSKIMQGIQQVYTQRYNWKNKRSGHVFQQRYKAKLCKKDEYLLTLIRYIHENPIKAGITDDIRYKWSSHNTYLRGSYDDLVDIDFPLSLFSRSISKARKRYINFMNKDEGQINYNNSYRELNNDIKQKKKCEKVIPIAELVEIIEKISKVSIDELRKKSRVQRYTDTRKAIIILGHRYTKASNKQLSYLLNVTESLISKTLSGRYKKTEFLSEIIEEVESKLISQA